jgi:hypothetical protein
MGRVGGSDVSVVQTLVLVIRHDAELHRTKKVKEQ